MKRFRALSSAPLALILAASLTGCGTPMQERFFTLAAEPPSAATVPAAATFSIVVGPVTVPDVVDRPQLVLRSTPNRVDIVEEARWAAPLKSEIPRVVADNLASLLPGARTATSTQRATAAPDYRVLIDVQRFDSAATEGATIQALWSITAKDGAPLTGSTLATEPAGAGYDALVAAHSRALVAVSRDIAAAITAARGVKR
jgi:uncharacterized lipoprotein YmbA